MSRVSSSAAVTPSRRTHRPARNSVKAGRVWTLRREGKFTAKPVGNNHCGFGATRFWYECSVSCSMLDAQGFVIDTLAIRDIVNSAKEVSLSCEQHAERIAEQVFELLDEKQRTCVPAITVKVRTASPGTKPHGEATFTWNPTA